MPKDFDKEVERMILENEEKMELLEGQFDYAFEQSFADSDKANAAMEAMSKNSGESAVHEALRLTCNDFGELPDSAAAAAQAREQRLLLPGLYAQYRVLRDKTDALRKTAEIRSEKAAEKVRERDENTLATVDRQHLLRAQEEWKKKNAALKTGEKHHEKDLDLELEADD